MHFFQATYETTDHLDNVIGSQEVKFVYEILPDEADTWEVKIINIHVEVTTIAGGLRWFDAMPEEYERYRGWANDKLLDAMVAHALDARSKAAKEARG